MLNVRHKSDQKSIFKLIELRPNLCRVEFYGKHYYFPDKPIAVCKQIGKSGREEFLNLENLQVNQEDNPGLLPIRHFSGYKYKMTSRCISLMHCLLVTSQNNDGTGQDIILNSTDLGQFKSMDLLKDFCKKYKLNLINKQ